MRKILVFVILAIFGFAMASYAETVKIPQLECSIDIPDGWEWKDWKMNTLGIAIGNEDLNGYGWLYERNIDDFLRKATEENENCTFEVKVIVPDKYIVVNISKNQGYNSINFYWKITPNKVISIGMHPFQGDPSDFPFGRNAKQEQEIIAKYLDIFEKMALSMQPIKQ